MPSTLSFMLVIMTPLDAVRPRGVADGEKARFRHHLGKVFYLPTQTTHVVKAGKQEVGQSDAPDCSPENQRRAKIRKTSLVGSSQILRRQITSSALDCS